MKKPVYICFLIVPVVIVLCTLILPLVLQIIPTFTRPAIGLGNYIRFFQDDLNRSIFLRSVRLSVITTLLCILVGVPTAYYLSMQSEKRRRLLNSLILFPLLTNAVIRSFAWISILSKQGFLNQLLKLLHLPQGTFLYTDGAIVVGSVYLFLPIMINTLSPIMENIGTETVEAAHSLGARPVRVFFEIILPLSFSGVLIAGVMVFGGAISAYTTPSMLGGNKKMMLSTLLYQQSGTLANWDAASLISVIMLVCSLGVMKLFNSLAKRIDKREAGDV